MRTYAQQKAALTRAINSGERSKVRAECLRTVAEWDAGEWHNGRPGQRAPVRPGAWPDDWARWQRALNDAYPVFQAPDLHTLAREVIL